MSYKYLFNAQFPSNGGFVGLESPECRIGFATEDGCLGILEDSMYKKFTVIGPTGNISAEIRSSGKYIKILLFDGIAYRRVYKSNCNNERFKFMHRNCYLVDIEIRPTSHKTESRSTSAINVTSFTMKCKMPFTLKHVNIVNANYENKIRIYRGTNDNLSFALDSAYDGFYYSTSEVAQKARLLYVLYLNPCSGMSFNQRITCDSSDFLLFIAEKPVRMYFGMSKKIPP